MMTCATLPYHFIGLQAASFGWTVEVAAVHPLPTRKAISDIGQPLCKFATVM